MFLSVENEEDTPKIIKLPFDERRELLSFFGIDANPFVDAVDPSFYFKTPQHETAYKKMRHCIEDGISMGLLTAASGMGKTLILQLLKQHLPEDKYTVIDLKVEKGLTKAPFLKNVLYALGYDKIFQGQNVTINNLMLLMNNKLQSNYEKEGKRLVLLLDEAQFLCLDLLYLLKIISNIEVPQKKLATIILFGEQLLVKRLKQKNFASLANRMYIKESIKPLNIFEMKQYLQYKLEQVNFKGELFSPEIYNVLFVATDGICREINNLVYNALIEAFYMKKKIIDYDVMLKCLR
ncbi:ExeA family protein [Candidatus Margulisiibacteriota bacterium]